MKYLSHIHVPPALFGFFFLTQPVNSHFLLLAGRLVGPPSSSFSQGSCCDITALQNTKVL